MHVICPSASVSFEGSIAVVRSAAFCILSSDAFFGFACTIYLVSGFNPLITSFPSEAGVSHSVTGLPDSSASLYTAEVSKSVRITLSLATSAVALILAPVSATEPMLKLNPTVPPAGIPVHVVAIPESIPATSVTTFCSFTFLTSTTPLLPSVPVL